MLATLRDMDAETRAGAHDLYAAYQSSGSDEPLQVLDAFTQSQYTGLLDLLSQLPQAVRPAAKSSLSLLTIVRATTVRIARPQQHARQSARHHHHRSSAPSTDTTGTPRTTSTPAQSGGSTSTTPAGGTSPSTTKSAPAGTTVPTIPVLPTSVPVPTTIPTLVPVPDLSGSTLLGP
jgi:hypothetical protein